MASFSTKEKSNKRASQGDSNEIFIERGFVHSLWKSMLINIFDLQMSSYAMIVEISTCL